MLICSVLSSTYPLPPLALLPLALLQLARPLLALPSASFTPRPRAQFLCRCSLHRRCLHRCSLHLRSLHGCSLHGCSLQAVIYLLHTPSHACSATPSDSVMRSYFTCCMLRLRAPRVGPSMRPSGTACDGTDRSIMCAQFHSCEYGYIRSVHVNNRC